MFIVAKENLKIPEGWSYFKEFEMAGDQIIPINTMIMAEACIFFSKEEAAFTYWRVSQYFYGYRIYPYYITKGQNIYA